MVVDVYSADPLFILPGNNALHFISDQFNLIIKLSWVGGGQPEFFLSGTTLSGSQYPLQWIWGSKPIHLAWSQRRLLPDGHHSLLIGLIASAGNPSPHNLWRP